MIKGTFAMLALSISVVACAQKSGSKATGQTGDMNTLLWKISGNGLEKPSYLFGTIHLLCADDANLSGNMQQAIRGADEVYFEVDMSNMMTEMFSMLGKLKMRGDTTLKDLLSDEEYELVKNYFRDNASMLPFSMLETIKPILAVSVVQSDALPCDNSVMMEQVIMDEASRYDKKIGGLETLAYQAGIMDSIPYKQQAQELVTYIRKSAEQEGNEMNNMWDAYNEQDLKKLEEMMMDSDIGVSSYADILLFNRNRNWVEKLKTLLPGKSLVIAVGAGHLPGEQGVINLLRKAGYTVTPVANNVVKGKTI